MIAVGAELCNNRSEIALAQIADCYASGESGKRFQRHDRARKKAILAQQLPRPFRARLTDVTLHQHTRIEIGEAGSHHDESRSSRSVAVSGAPCSDRGV